MHFENMVGTTIGIHFFIPLKSVAATTMSPSKSDKCDLRLISGIQIEQKRNTGSYYTLSTTYVGSVTHPTVAALQIQNKQRLRNISINVCYL
jgi:hypothetical protein